MRISYFSKTLLIDVVALFVILFFGYLYIKWPFYKYIESSWSMIYWLVGILFFVILFGNLMRRIGKRIRGKHAELDIAGKLFDLPVNYRILTNLEIGSRGDVDCVVIGPTGIWAIEIKSHIGSIGFDGQQLTRDGRRFPEKNFLNQVWAQKKLIEEVVLNELGYSTNVQPVIVFSDRFARVRFGFKKQKGVYVVGYDWIEKLIVDPPFSINMDEIIIEKIFNTLNKYA